MSKEAEIIPGTEYMRYDNDIHFAIKTGSGRQRDLVLVPQPSDDPHDPLVSEFSLLSCESVRRMRIDENIELVANMEVRCCCQPGFLLPCQPLASAGNRATYSTFDGRIVSSPFKSAQES